MHVIRIGCGSKNFAVASTSVNARNQIELVRNSHKF